MPAPSDSPVAGYPSAAAITSAANFAPDNSHLCAVGIEDEGKEGALECLIERGDYRVRLADTHGQRNQASMLIKRLYSWRGYQTSNSPAVEESHDPNRVTLEVSSVSGNHLFGTLTVAKDSASGLLADHLYKADIDTWRAKPNVRACEMSKLAVDPEYGSKEVLASLYHLGNMYAIYYFGCTDLFIEVNPRHVKFYKRMMGFEQAGEERMCERVKAPAVLLHLDLGYLSEQVAKWGGTKDPRERSLYPYFFSKPEETALVRRLLNPSD